MKTLFNKKNKKILTGSLIVAATLALLSPGCKKTFNKNTSPVEESEKKPDYYTCPMHPQIQQSEPGNCPICGMKLVPFFGKHNHVDEKASESKPKILFYRNPMNPEITSPTPMKDSMGMDYIPVYEKTASDKTVTIPADKQEMIGILKEKVKTIDLNRIIRASGKIAYDPDLVIKQEEFIQALNSSDALRASGSEDSAGPVRAVIEAAKRKLKLQGMSDSQIANLERTRKAQTNLYLPASGENVWAYVSVYEYEFGAVKPGYSVELEAVAYPGETFYGVVRSINPVMDAATRTGLVRVEVVNPGDKLKPEMFISASIKVFLGRKLAVPENAVLDTGVRKIVYVSRGSDSFEWREVRLGQKAQGYYEVISGLKDGDLVVTSGNFLVDSESRLQSPGGR